MSRAIRAGPLLIATAGAATTSLMLARRSPISAEERPQKLSIYDSPTPPPTLVEYHTELEKQVGDARRGLLSATESARSGLHGLVNKWLDVERKLEGEVKSVLPANEPLNPGLLYVGVATLAGSVFTRYRAFPLRILAPPTMLVLSLNLCLPQLSHNLSQYYLGLEKQHLPVAVREARESIMRTVDGARHSVEQGAKDVKGATKEGWSKTLGEVQKSTGLLISGESEKIGQPAQKLV